MRTWALAGLTLVLVGACVGGCHPPVTTSSTTEKPAPKTDPDATLREQLRVGHFQIGAAVDALQTARLSLEKLADGPDPVLADAAGDALDRIDEIGQSLTEVDSNPPEVEDVHADYAGYDEKRLNAIEALIDAIYAAEDLVGIIDDLLEQAKFKDDANLTKAGDCLDSCDEALRDAVVGLGGKIPKELEDDEPVSPST